MPRQSRKELVSNFVHIMVQGINKEYIFEEDYYKKKYLKIIQNKIRDYKNQLISYCVMDNHVHLVVHYESIDELSVFMKRINTAYAKWYNEHKGRVGYVFRDRYKTEQILDFHHLYACINYVHNNPVKANIVAKPEQYIFSSYKDYLSEDFIINSKLFQILNLSVNDFKEIFINSKDLYIYKHQEISSKKIIDNYLRSKDAESLNELSSTKQKKELIEEVKEKTRLNYLEIARLLNMSRATLYRIKKQ